MAAVSHCKSEFEAARLTQDFDGWLIPMVLSKDAIIKWLPSSNRDQEGAKKASQ